MFLPPLARYASVRCDGGAMVQRVSIGAIGLPAWAILGDMAQTFVAQMGTKDRLGRNPGIVEPRSAMQKFLLSG